MAGSVKIGFTGIWFKPFWGFTQDQYVQHAEEMKGFAATTGATVVASPQAWDTAEGAAEAARVMNQTDLCVLSVEAYPEGKAALAFFDALKVPLVLWSRDEQVHGNNIGHNSFCGANFLAGNLGLKQRRFRAMHGAISDRAVAAKLRTAVRLIGAAKACQGAKIGLFGEGIVPKFHDIDIDTRDRAMLKSRYGMEFVNVPIKDLVERAKSYPAAAMAQGGKEFGQRFTLTVPDGGALEKQARMLRAIQETTNEGGFGSIAVRCWPELQTMYEAWPCPSLSALNDLGVPTACEGDPGGALDMLLMTKLAKGATTLLDVVDWDDAHDTFAIWHCGPTACSWADGETKLLGHDVDGRTADGKAAWGLPGIVDMDFKPGPVTLVRTLGALDDEFAVEGQIVRTPARHITGSFGTVAQATNYGRPIGVAAIREMILTRSLPHHYTAARGHAFA